MKKLLLTASLMVMMICGLAFVVIQTQPAKAQLSPIAIYIRSDGNVDPSTAPINQNGNIYTLTGNTQGNITIQKDDIILDGASYTLQGNYGEGIYVLQRNNVTIRNFVITDFSVGIELENATNIKIMQNNITTYTYENGINTYNSTNNIITNNTIFSYANIDMNQNSGIYLRDSSNNTVSQNYVVGSWIGISIENENNSVVSGNRVTQSQFGIQLMGSNQNQVFGNNVFDTVDAISHGVLPDSGSGIRLYGKANNNQVYENNMTNNGDGMDVWFGSASNTIYDNNFVNNTRPVSLLNETTSGNSWDNGSLGNYWSDYVTKYPNATEIGSTGIGNTPYVIDSNNIDLIYSNNIDHYPLMKPVTVPEFPAWIILPLFAVIILISMVFIRKRVPKN
jgi:parallel beta-helix repeat protein